MAEGDARSRKVVPAHQFHVLLNDEAQQFLSSWGDTHSFFEMTRPCHCGIVWILTGHTHQCAITWMVGKLVVDDFAARLNNRDERETKGDQPIYCRETLDVPYIRIRAYTSPKPVEEYLDVAASCQRIIMYCVACKLGRISFGQLSQNADHALDPNLRECSTQTDKDAQTEQSVTICCTISWAPICQVVGL